MTPCGAFSCRVLIDEEEAMRRERSITRNTLTKMGVRIAVVIIASTAIAYYHMTIFAILESIVL